MLSADEALQAILQRIHPLKRTEEIPLSQAAGRTLAEDVTAHVDLPPFDNSAMDGFAIRTQDTQGASSAHPVRLPVQDTVIAGAQGARRLEPGKAITIMTGAPLPDGADAVVMKELTRTNNGQVEILYHPKPNEHIRRRGEDVRSGDVVLRQGCRLRPYEIALLAAQGRAAVRVGALPVVAVIATGNELMPPDTPRLETGQIYDANGPALLSAVTRWGFPTVDCGIVPDQRQMLEKTLQEAVERSDLLLVSGGVSVGDFDFTKGLLEELGLTVVFWKVAIKPGKPLLFGLWREKPVFGLPGNPVSALVCLEEFVRPALEQLGESLPGHPRYHLQGTLDSALWKEEGRQQYVFARVSESGQGYQVSVIRPQGSAMVGMTCKANVLVRIPAEVRHLPRGAPVAFRWLK